MSLVDVILSRRSVRRYRPDPVPGDVLERILEAGRLAPSADNVQPWHFVVVTDPELKRGLSRGRWNWFIEDSAFTVVGCGDVGTPYGRRWSTIDTSIALENMVLAAWAQGVGSCWVGDFREDEVKSLLGIPEHLKVVALVSFGYPAETPSPTGKKALPEIVHYNKF